MNSSKPVLLVSGLVLAMSSVFAAGEAQAALSTRLDLRNPTDVCQTALPVFDGQVRKRPKAVQNEGTSVAFVTCSFPSQGTYTQSVNNPTSVRIYFGVNDGVADSVTCTGVSGYQGQTIPNSVKTVSLPASGAQASLVWVPADFGATGNLPNGLFSVSCELNPGVGINDSNVNFAEEIGT